MSFRDFHKDFRERHWIQTQPEAEKCTYLLSHPPSHLAVLVVTTLGEQMPPSFIWYGLGIRGLRDLLLQDCDYLFPVQLDGMVQGGHAFLILDGGICTSAE